MKPETYKLWEEALSCLNNAEKLVKDKNLNKAVNEATGAFMIGVKAVMELS